MGMVGGGQGAFIGWVHRMAAALDQQVEFVAGCFSRDFENNRLTGKQLYLDPARCYPSYQEMAKAEASLPPDQRIDFVSIVTPNDSHFPIAKSFLEAGIHVVCDKPMTYTLKEAHELVKLVEDSGLVFALTHNYTGHPEGYLEAFATIYCGAVEAMRKHIDGAPMKTEDYDFPTVYDGLRGIQFITKAVESSNDGAVWVELPKPD